MRAALYREAAPMGPMGLVALVVLAGLIAGPFALADDAPAPAPEAATSAPAPDAPSEASPTPALVRVSSSFEIKHAGAVLKQVAKLFSAGFVRKDAERIAAEIDAQPAEFGDLDLDFFSPPEISAAVRSAVDHYLNGRGL